MGYHCWTTHSYTANVYIYIYRYIEYIQRGRKLNPFDNKGFPEKLSRVSKLIVKKGRVYRILARIVEKFRSCDFLSSTITDGLNSLNKDWIIPPLIGDPSGKRYRVNKKSEPCFLFARFIFFTFFFFSFFASYRICMRNGEWNLCFRRWIQYSLRFTSSSFSSFFDNIRRRKFLNRFIFPSSQIFDKCSISI